MAQVKVRVKIENADTRRRGVTAQVVGQPAETGEGDFMPPAQPQRQVALFQQVADQRRVGVLCAFEVAARTCHVTRVVERRRAVPGQIGQRFAQGGWPLARAGSALIAFHSFVTGQANQRRARGQARRQRLDPLVPAQRALPFGGVNAPGPQGHVRYNGHAKTPITVSPVGRSGAGLCPASNGSGARCAGVRERPGP